MKKFLSACLVMAIMMVYSAGAFALEVPTDVTVQNLNGTQQYIKTFTVPAATDPDALIEEPFDYEGYTYTFSFITKQENRIEEEKHYTEVVTVETANEDLSTVIAALTPKLEYDDGQYQGTLSLDHTTIHTEAAGYTSKSYTVSETKVFENLSSNDMSYVPGTTVKNGVTLQLAGVDWQVQATALVDDVLVPSQYKAVANYVATSSYRAATGYISTAEYSGTISCSGVDSITYTLTYVGTETSAMAAENGGSILKTILANPWIIGFCLALLGAIILGVLLVRAQREISRLRGMLDYRVEASDADYEEIQEEEE